MKAWYFSDVDFFYYTIKGNKIYQAVEMAKVFKHAILLRFGKGLAVWNCSTLRSSSTGISWEWLIVSGWNSSFKITTSTSTTLTSLFSRPWALQSLIWALYCLIHSNDVSKPLLQHFLQFRFLLWCSISCKFKLENPQVAHFGSEFDFLRCSFTWSMKYRYTPVVNLQHSHWYVLWLCWSLCFARRLNEVICMLHIVHVSNFESLCWLQMVFKWTQ